MEEDGRCSKSDGEGKEKEMKMKGKKTEGASGGGDDAKNVKSTKSSSKSSKFKSRKLTDFTLGQAQAKEASTLLLSTPSFEMGRVERQSGWCADAWDVFFRFVGWIWNWSVFECRRGGAEEAQYFWD